MDVGIMAGYDIGRVWAENESSNEWHKAFSYGAWFTPFSMAVVNVFYSMTPNKEEDALTVRVGFFF